MTKRPFASRPDDSGDRDHIPTAAGESEEAARSAWADDPVVVDWLREARRCIELAADLVSLHTESDFLADEHLQNSACFLLVRLREVERRLPADFKRGYPAVPWAKISGMANIVAHEYTMTADMRLVWRALVVRFPELSDQLALDDWNLDANARRV